MISGLTRCRLVSDLVFWTRQPLRVISGLTGWRLVGELVFWTRQPHRVISGLTRWRLVGELVFWTRQPHRVISGLTRWKYCRLRHESSHRWESKAFECSLFLKPGFFMYLFLFIYLVIPCFAHCQEFHLFKFTFPVHSTSCIFFPLQPHCGIRNVNIDLYFDLWFEELWFALIWPSRLTGSNAIYGWLLPDENFGKVHSQFLHTS